MKSLLGAISCKPKVFWNLKALNFGIYFSILPALSLFGKEGDKIQEFPIHLISVASIFIYCLVI